MRELDSDADFFFASSHGGLMLQTKFWAELTSRDFQARDMMRTIAVLPVAATEQHGPHLPFGTDTMIMVGYIETVIARLPDALPVLFLPVQNAGFPPSTRAFRERSAFRPEQSFALGQNFANACERPAAASSFFSTRMAGTARHSS